MLHWLIQQIDSEAKVQTKGELLFFQGGEKDNPPSWMWEKTSEAYKTFEKSESVGLSWEEVKAIGNKRKSA